MALSSAFKERFEHMEHTRNQRLFLLQQEKELQAKNSQVLALKIASLQSAERRCLMLDQKIATQNFKISALSSEIENLDLAYNTVSEKLRFMKNEIEELKELEKERDMFYELKSVEMKDFRENVERFKMETLTRVDELRKYLNELKSTFVELQGSNVYLRDSEITAAETRKTELIAMKEYLSRCLVSNYQTRAHWENMWRHQVKK